MYFLCVFSNCQVFMEFFDIVLCCFWCWYICLYYLDAVSLAHFNVYNSVWYGFTFDDEVFCLCMNIATLPIWWFGSESRIVLTSPFIVISLIPSTSHLMFWSSYSRLSRCSSSPILKIMYVKIMMVLFLGWLKSNNHWIYSFFESTVKVYSSFSINVIKQRHIFSFITTNRADGQSQWSFHWQCLCHLYINLNILFHYIFVYGNVLAIHLFYYHYTFIILQVILQSNHLMYFVKHIHITIN